MKLKLTYNREKEMYPDVVKWLKQYLANKYQGWKIETFDTSKITLYQFLLWKGIQDKFPDYITYDVKVDVTGVLNDPRRDMYFLVLVECKLKPISLKDISQILGYSRVVRPLRAMIISPRGLTPPVTHLLQKLRRYDVLAYDFDNRGKATKYVRVGVWDATRKEVLPNSWIPP